MPHLGIRVTPVLKEALQEAAERSGKSVSAIVKEALERYCLNVITDVYRIDNWRILAWNFFGVDITKVEYALGRSHSAEEFFGYFSKWLTDGVISLTPDENKVIVNYTTQQGHKIKASTSRNNPKEQIISNIIHQLEENFTATIAEDLEI